MIELDTFFKRTLEFETDEYEIYTSSGTEVLENSCTRYMNGYPKLIGHRVRIVKSKKNGDSIYVLYNKKGEPIKSSYQFDDLGMQIELMRFIKKRR